MDKSRKKRNGRPGTSPDAPSRDDRNNIRRSSDTESEGGSRQGNVGHERSGDKGMGNRQGG